MSRETKVDRPESPTVIFSDHNDGFNDRFGDILLQDPITNLLQSCSDYENHLLKVIIAEAKNLKLRIPGDSIEIPVLISMVENETQSKAIQLAIKKYNVITTLKDILEAPTLAAVKLNSFGSYFFENKHSLHQHRDSTTISLGKYFTLWKSEGEKTCESMQRELMQITQSA